MSKEEWDVWEKQRINWSLRRLHVEDLDLLHLLKDRGAMDKRTIRRHLIKLFDHNPDEIGNSFRRCKSYGTIMPVTRGTNYLYDLTIHGMKVIETFDKAATGKVETVQKY